MIDRTHPDYWREYRKLEVRPGVFHIQWRKRCRFFKWEWWDDIWMTQKHYRVPGIPEYSPIDPTEYSADVVDKYIDLTREAYRTQYWRGNPPPGYPRVV